MVSSLVVTSDARSGSLYEHKKHGVTSASPTTDDIAPPASVTRRSSHVSTWADWRVGPLRSEVAGLPGLQPGLEDVEGPALVDEQGRLGALRPFSTKLTCFCVTPLCMASSSWLKPRAARQRRSMAPTSLSE